MATSALLVQLRRNGFTVSRNGDHLIVAPRDRLTDDLRAAIRDGKRELLEALTTEQTIVPVSDLVSRIRAMAKRWGFSTDELSEELERAAADPSRALLWVDRDERTFGTGERPYVRH
jgi:hypothetical protein